MDVGFFEVVFRLAAVLFTLVACFVGFVALRFHRLHMKWAHMPGPPRDSFFMGNVPTIRKLRKEKKHFFAQTLQHWYQSHGQTFILFVMHTPLVFTMDPEGIKEMLITGSHNKPKDWKMLGFLFGERFIGKGLVTEPSQEKWAKRRSIMNPAFHRKFLRSIISEFNAVADDLVTKLVNMADGSTIVDLEQELHRATLDIIGKVAFDKDLDSLNNDESPFPKAISTAFQAFTVKVQDPLSTAKFWKYRELKQKARESCRILRKSGKHWLTERRQAMARGEEVPDDILTLIIKAEEEYPDVMDLETMVDDIVTFFVAGQETTANSLSFSLLEIARRKDIKDKACEEIRTVIGDRNYLEFEDVNKLEYLSKIMKESLRMYPSATILFRETARDIALGGHHVYKDTRVVMGSFISGRSEEFHKEALTFNPDRFDQECDYRPSMYTYFPFSLGERNCIGQNFAQIEGKLFMVKILQKFDIEVAPNYVFGLKEDLTLRPENGVKCTLTLRE